ncbi:MAG: Gx transporter family protein [Oscillospiraceae bacterium]|nr:Gx transporter family protein [Oscillospiraceae bacterium]
MKLKTADIALFALLTSLALAVSFFESFLPTALIPLPGVKLGLANTVTIFALYSLGFCPALIILICRCFLASLFSGGITALMFSLSGGIFALCVMQLCKRCRYLSIYGASIGGAAAHGIGQILAACVMLGSFSAIFYLPLLLLSSVLTGILTAFISQILIKTTNNMFKR